MKNKKKQKNTGKYLFFLSIIALYGGLYIYNSTLFFNTLNFFVKTLTQIIPTLLLVFVIMFLFNLFVTPQALIKHMGESAKIKSWIITLTSGVISSGPIYIWFPLMKELRRHGINDSLVTAFLYSRAVKIPLLPMMIYYFGIPFTVIVTLCILTFSILNGLIVSMLTQHKQHPL